jgi:amidase
MNGLHRLPATELVAMIRRGEITPDEVQRHFLDRAANDRHNAFFALRQETVRADVTTPLAGLPIALKDTAPTAALPTTFGSAAFIGHQPAEDAPIARRWASAGAVCIGKSATSEFGTVCFVEPDPRLADTPRNPYDSCAGVGGSSGGSAAAVAAELVPLAHGSDSGGSVRIPAALNGVVGFKPSGPPHSGPLTWADLDVDGIIARSVADVTLAATALGVAQPCPPTDRLRIGVSSDLAGVAAPVRTAVRKVADTLANLGHDVVETVTRTQAGIAEAYLTAWAAHIAAIDVPAERLPDLHDVTRLLRALGAAVQPGELAEDYAVLAAARRRATDDPCDVEVSPVTISARLAIGELCRSDPVETLAAQANFAPFTVRANVEGRPSVTIPVTVPQEQRQPPPGVMLTGRRGYDRRLLALAATVECVAGGFRRPAVSVSGTRSTLTNTNAPRAGSPRR